jgi:hypothetical protein
VIGDLYPPIKEVPERCDLVRNPLRFHLRDEPVSRPLGRLPRRMRLLEIGLQARDGVLTCVNDRAKPRLRISM